MKINRGVYHYFIFSILIGLIVPCFSIAQPNAAFRNPNLSNDKRVKDLLLKLTPEEKISLLIASSQAMINQISSVISDEGRGLQHVSKKEKCCILNLVC